MSKDDIAGMFERVTREIHPDLTAVIGKAEQRGRRLRARRRVAIVLTAIASATAISIAATLGTRLALRDVRVRCLLGLARIAANRIAFGPRVTARKRPMARE